VATQAMCDQYDRTTRAVYGEVQLVDPRIAMGTVPPAQLNSLASPVVPLPQRLPMVGATVIKARNKQHEWLPG